MAVRSETASASSATTGARWASARGSPEAVGWEWEEIELLSEWERESWRREEDETRRRGVVGRPVEEEGREREWEERRVDMMTRLRGREEVGGGGRWEMGDGGEVEGWGGEVERWERG